MMAWRTLRLKNVVSLVVHSAAEEDDLPYVGLEAIEPWTGKITLDVKEADEQTSVGNRFLPGDVLFGKLRPYLAKVAAPSFSGQCTGEALVLRPKSGVNTRFIRYRLVEAGFIDSVNASTFGAKMPRASWQFLGNLRFPLPDPDTQQVISDFLDRETVLIDQLIEKKKRMEDVLVEAFQIARDHTFAVVQASAPISNLRWMIEDVCDGPFGSGLTSAHYSPGGVRVIRLQNIKDGFFDDRDAVFISEEYYDTLGDHDVLGGDLLVAGLGDEKNRVGRACVAPLDLGPAMVKADCFRVRLRPSFSCHEFAAEFLNSNACWPQIQALSKGVTRSRINLELLRRIRMPVCGPETQRRVVTEVAGQRSRLSGLLASLTESRTKLAEFRSALITAAVTGQIDVTTWGKQGQIDRRLDKIQEEMGA